jgi:hypothetical protein
VPLVTSPSEERKQLADLEQAFDRGDYRAVREGTAAILRESRSRAVKKSASALRARTEADPAVKWLFAMAAAVIVLVTAYWLTHQPH